MTGRHPLLYAVCAVILAAPAAARADAANGHRIATQWCASCHIIAATAPERVTQGPPSFQRVAETVSVDQLRTFLTKPHGAMPDLSLSRSEIADLTAYIQSLR